MTACHSQKYVTQYKLFHVSLHTTNLLAKVKYKTGVYKHSQGGEYEHLHTRQGCVSTHRGDMNKLSGCITSTQPVVLYVIGVRVFPHQLKADAITFDTCRQVLPAY